MKKGVIWFLVSVLIIGIVLGYFSLVSKQNSEEQNISKEIINKTKIANPASIYCINHGGNLTMRTDSDGSQYGVCVFSDGSECDEWKFFRGECNLTLSNISSSEECSTDSDCVPASCCHPDSCVNKNYPPSCSGVMCTMNCEPGTLDCGQGSCRCINKKCSAVVN